MSTGVPCQHCGGDHRDPKDVEIADLLFALKAAVGVAAEAARAWDADNDSRVGKLLLALEGSKKGIRADIDAIHDVIAKAEGRS